MFGYFAYWNYPKDRLRYWYKVKQDRPKTIKYIKFKKELEKKQIQAELKQELERKKVDEMEIDIYRFSNKVTKAKTLFDKDAFAEKHPKLFKQFTKEGAASTRFLFGLIKS